MCCQLSTPPTPASEDLLCKFVTYLALNNISANTIKVYLLGVCQLHLQAGLPPPPTVEMAKLTQVLRGIKISQAMDNQLKIPSRQRLLITPEILQQVKARWQQDSTSQDRIMLWAAFLTCFFSFFRSGEICSHQSDVFDPASDMAVGNVTIDSIVKPCLIRIQLPR